MRMHIAQHEAEERKLVNYLHAIAQQVLVVDDAGGTPPPPSPTKIEPPPGDPPVAYQLFYVKPPPEARRAQPLGVEHLEDSLQVAKNGNEKRAQQGDEVTNQRVSSTPLPLCSPAPLLPCSLAPPLLCSLDEIVHQRVGPRHCQSEQQRDAQVEGLSGSHARQLGEHGHHQVAEVIVTDSEPGQPGVVGREGGAAQDSVEKGELHGLLRAHDLRIVGSVEGKKSEGQREQDLVGHDQTPVLAQEVSQSTVSPAVEPPRGCRHHQNREEDTSPTVA